MFAVDILGMFTNKESNDLIMVSMECSITLNFVVILARLYKSKESYCCHFTIVVGIASHFKVFCQSFLCYGQGTLLAGSPVLGHLLLNLKKLHSVVLQVQHTGLVYIP